MRQTVEIEDIEEMRRREGIEDVVLRKEIRGLRVRDVVKLTLMNRAISSAGETLRVRITSIKGDEFRGKLVSDATLSGLTDLRIGCSVAFTSAHIHSLSKGRLDYGRRRAGL
jgi:hypothetical protein